MDRLQRACATLCTDIGGALAGRVGHDAICFVVYMTARREDRLRAKLAAFADRVIRFARRTLGTDLACGIGRRARSGAELPVRHDEALWAALWGLHNGVPVTFYADAAGPHDATSPVALYRSSRSLCESFSLGRAQASMVAAQQIIKDVLWISGGSLQAMRSHFLEVVWELLSIAERRHGTDERASSDTLASITSRLQLARTAHQMTTTFTSIVGELLQAALRPGLLGRRAKLERARRLVEQAGPDHAVDLATIAKRVGLSPGHFSRCFRQAYGMAFGRFVLGSRLKRGQRLLRETRLRIGDVAAEAGFSSASYFVQAFKRATGMTPTAYRSRQLGALTAQTRASRTTGSPS
jgi:AraC-like DNA-binding protein